MSIPTVCWGAVAGAQPLGAGACLPCRCNARLVATSAAAALRLGRRNLTTVALIEGFGISSERGEVVELADYMAQFVAEPAEAEAARL